MLNAYKDKNLVLTRIDQSVLNIPKGSYEAWKIQNIKGNSFTDPL